MVLEKVNGNEIALFVNGESTTLDEVSKTRSAVFSRFIREWAVNENRKSGDRVNVRDYNGKLYEYSVFLRY